jgi:kynurenine formamidase
MPERKIPTRAEVEAYLRRKKNWGRWTDNGSAGAVNLVTPAKRLAAARLVKKGRTVSLSRPWPVTPTAENVRPAQHYTFHVDELDGDWKSAHDYIGIAPHGIASSHIDALCHMWSPDGMWDGRDPAKEVTPYGVRYGSVDAWRDGIVTRGVLLDVPRHRRKAYVTYDSPVHGWELAAIAKEHGVEPQPGDALLVYSGREAFAKDHGGTWGGHPTWPGRWAGLHASCLWFIREHDIAVLGWDMMDQYPNEYGISFGVHGALFYFGVALLDNLLLEPLAQACADEGRYEFMLVVAPLVIPGATGSPANPIAIF